MRFLIFSAAFLVFTAAIPKNFSPRPTRLENDQHKPNPNGESSFDQEIMQALKSIEKTRHTIESTTKSEPTTDITQTEGFFDNIENAVSNMIPDFSSVHIPFISSTEEDNHSEKKALLESNKITFNSTVASNDLLTKTRDELKRDFSVLQNIYKETQAQLDEWVISNRHQNVKAVFLGALSAVIVIIFYTLIRSICRRRSRVGALAAFANDDWANKSGDNESLLPITKKNHRYLSDSEDEI